MPGDPRPPFDQPRMELVEQIGRLVQGLEDYDTILRLAVNLVVPGFAEIAVLIADHSRGEQLRMAHADPELHGWTVERVRSVLPALRSAAFRDYSKGRGFRWVPHVSEISLQFLRGEPEVAELLYDLQVRSFVVVALRAGGRALGALALGRTGQLPFQAADLAIAQILAHRIASGLQNAQLYERGVDEQSRRIRLEAAVQKWVRVFDLAGWGAAIVDDADHRIEVVNPAFARLHGYTKPADLIGRLYTDLLEANRVDELAQWVSSPDIAIHPYETVHVRADGTAFPVLTDVTPLEMSEGATSFVVTIQDVTDLKRTEDRLRRAQRLEAVGRLAGGVAHEVNNMMTIILGFSDLLSRSGSVTPGRERDIEEIRKAAGRAGKITQQLLAFSRQQILQPKDLPVNEVVGGLESMLRLTLPANIELEARLAPISPIVHADRAQLEQVIINLVFNARDAMAGGGLLRLTTGSRHLNEQDGTRLIGIPIPASQYACVSVVDTGHGMDQVTLAQVFEPFFTTKPVGAGTGLGLATVYGIVKQSGGYVWVQSEQGMGTTVTVCLPQVVGPAPPPMQPSHDGTPAERRPGTVLLVEDEPGVRELTSRVLAEQGYRIIEARDGDEAIAKLKEFGPGLDLVLSDVIVPNIGTTELEQLIRRMRVDLPILYMSGYSREEVIERGLIKPGRPFLQKPFTPEELGEVVSRQLELARDRGGTVST